MAEFALPAPKDYDPDTGLPVPPKAPAPRAAISDYAKSLASGIVNTNVTAPGQLSVLAGGSSEQRAHGQDIERRLLESLSPEGAQVAANKVVNPDFTIGETPIQSVLMSAAQSLPSMVQAVQFGAPIARAAAQARVGERVTAGLGSMPGAATIGRLAENAPFGVIEGVQAGAQNAAQVGQQIRDTAQTPDEMIAQSPEFQRALIESINAHPELPAQDHIKAARDAVAAAAERDVFGKTVPVTGGIGVLTGGGVLPRAARPFTGASREAGESVLKGIARGAREEAGQEFLQSGAEQIVQNAAVQKYANPEQALSEDVLNQAVTGAAAGGLMGAGGGAIGALPNRRRPQDVLNDPNAGTLDKAAAAGQLSGAIPTGPDGQPVDQPPPVEPGGEPAAPGGPTPPGAPTPGGTPPAGPSEADIERARREDEENPPRNWVEAGTPDPFEHLTEEDRDSAYDEAYFQLSEELAPKGLEPTEEEIRDRQVQILTELLLERSAAASGTPSSTGAGNGERQGQEAPASEVLTPPAGATPQGEAPAGSGTTTPGSGTTTGEPHDNGTLTSGLPDSGTTTGAVTGPQGGAGTPADTTTTGPQGGAPRGGGTIPGSIDEGAHGAATSPRNELPEPTEGQKGAGNYQKGHIRVSGLDVSIENPSGSTRSGTDESGKPWSTTMVDHYGYIKRTEGADSTEAKRQGVDAFVKAGTAQDHEGPVFVVDQTKPDGTFDEHKAMLGYASRADALRGYLRHYEKGWNNYNFVARMEPNEFRAWVMDKEATKEPLSEVIQPEGQAGGQAPAELPAGQAPTPPEAQPPAGEPQTPTSAGQRQGEPNAPTGPGTPPADVGQAPGAGVPEPTGGNSGGEAQSEPAGGGREVDSGEGGRGDGTGVPGDTGTAGSAPVGGNGAGVGPGTVTGDTPGDTPTEPKPPKEPKEPKPEVTAETPVGLGQARAHWNKNVPDEDKKGFENATFKTLAGIPHVIGTDTAFHFVRSPENPKTLEVKEGYASEEARVQHEGKKANPLDVMIAQGDLHGLAAAAYVGVREPTQDDLPVVLIDDRLVRFPVKLDEREAVEANLKKLKFRITDRAQESEKAERMVISAIYRPETGTIGDVGEQMGGGRKEQNPQPVIAKGADEKALDKFLADIAKAKLIDPESNPDRTFGAMMFKEGLLYFAKHPLDYIASILKRQSFEFSEQRSDRKVLLMALESPQWTTKVNGLATTYVERLTQLQGVIGPHANVISTVAALRATYLQPNTDRLNAEGDKLSRVMTTPLNVYLEKYGPLFGTNEENTDQTHRLVKKDPDSPPQLERIVRVGMKDHRGGKNIDAETDFKETFGFRGVEFGNWVNQVERQDNLNLAYDSLLDMADIAGFDARSIGLNDALGLAIGARGRGGSAAAHFEPDNNVINLTKTKGNGTVGHEWGHALDHYNRDDDNSKKLISSIKDALRQRLMIDRIEDRMRSILRQADQTTNRNVPPKKALFSAVRSTRYQGNPGQLYYSVREDTRFFKDARAMDEGASERYWSTPHELFARGWETFLFDKSRGGTPYLVGPSRGDGVLTPENGYKGTPYPRREEREYVSDLFKTMLEQLDPKTLRAKPYTVVARAEEIPEMGWVALDQHGASLVGDGFLYFYNTEADAKAAVAAQNGTERVLTIERLHYGQANQKIVPFLKDVDRIMEEMGIRLYPSVKNGSMAESMFFSLRQGWWPENNAALKTFAAQAHSIEPSAVDLLMLKQAQEDFEAALARYTAQIITDMRATGADDRAVYDRMVEMYGKQPNLDVRTTTSAANQAYSTPLPIAFVSGLLARVTPSTKVLDVTGGTGLLTITANPKNTIFIELEPHRALNLRLMEYGKVIEGNALEKLDTDVKAQEADALLLNPPFGAVSEPGKVQSWDGTTFELNKIDHLIAARAMRAMADNGRATIILGAHRQPGVVTSSDRYFLNWLYSNYNVADHFEIEGKLYARQGAGAPIRVLVVAGRKQTETGFPAGTAIDRVYDFDQLWSRYAQAYESSRDVVVGAGVKSDSPRGADSGGSGVPAGDQGQGGTTDREGGQRGGGSGPVAPGAGRGTPGGQRPGNAGAGTPADAGHRGDGAAGKPGTGATGEPGGRTGRDRGATGPDAGGLSGLTGKQVDDIFDDVFGKERAPRKAGAKSGGTTSGKRGTGTTSTEGRGKSVLDDIPGMSDILGDLERELKKGESPPDSPPALSRSAGEPFNTNEYARFKPYFERIWAKLRETISDIAERLRTFAQGVLQAFGKVIRPYARFFVSEVQQSAEQTVSDKKPLIADVGGPNQTPYKGRSKGDQAGIYMPDSHAKFIERAFDNLEAEHGDIDDFVAKELGYDSVEQMHAGLSGYQVDALGLALGQLKTGNGFIIGDDTGVGKGRTAAAIISWAKKNGKIPIFFSFKKDLYTDMYRDLTHIGRGDTKIMLTDGDARMLDLAGNVVVKNNNARAKAQIDHVIKNGELPPGIDAMFTTYYQVNKENARRQAIRRLVSSGKAVLVMDEAHNAAGESGTGKFIMQLLTGYGLDGSATKDEMGSPPPDGWKAPPTVYLSATFAKRPANMPVYIRTNLRHAADTPGELVGMFASGGDVLQRIASEMLVESGSMIRRERSYVGVKFETVIDEENGPRDARAVDNVTSVLRQIVYADRAFAEWVKGDGEEIVNTLMPPMWAATSSGQRADVSMNKSLFTSVVHNYVGQLLLATKVQKGVELAAAALNRGEKPIFALQNTMEAALNDYTSTAGVSVDDEMPGFGWQAILQRGLQSSHRVTFKQGTGDNAPRVRVTVPLNLMPDIIRNEFNRAQELIDAFKSDLPGSPIDALRAEMAKYVVWRDANGNWSAGREAPKGVDARPLNIVEVTGRQGAVDYSGAVPKYVLRKDPDNLDIIRGFQNGGVDAIILNSSGSTGISLHASVDAKDQRPRRMIVLQANPDIAVFKQTLGRTNRTGQVEWPSFSVLGTAIPAERRLLAVLKKKIGTLFSNTSGGEGTTAIDAVDFINQYGDVITNQYLQDNKDIAAFIGVELKDDPIDAMGADIALTASGRAALLTVDEQEAFFDTIEANFLQEIEMRNLTGTNALARRELDLQADPKWIGVLEEGMDEANPFTATANIVQYEVNVVGDIPTPEKVRDAIASSLKGRSPGDVVDAFVGSMKTKYDEANNQLMLKDQELQKKIDDPKATAKEKESLEARLASLRESINEMGARRERTIRFLKNGYAIGKGYDSFYVGDVESQAVVIAITQGKSTSKTGNPFSPSNVIIHFQRNVPNGRLAVPLSKLEFGSEIRAESPHYGDAPLDDWFSPRYVSGGRANRYIAVGNILRARKAVKNAGEILVHSLKGSTPDSPLLQNGILMPQSWNTQGLTGSDFTIRYVRAAVDYVALVLRQMYLNRFARNGDADDKTAADALAGLVKHEVPVPDSLPDQLLSGETLKGAGDKWWLSINRYGTPGIELIVSRKNAPELMKSKALANALGRDLVSRRGQSVATSPVVTGPERIRRVIEILAQAGAMTAPEHSSDFLREISKLHYQEELGRPVASRGHTKGGMPKQAVEAAAAKITSRWANAPTVVVVESLQDPAVPERLRMEDARQRSQGAQGEPEGFFDAGTVYLVAPQMSSERDVRRVLFHEALGHYGLRGLYGKGLAQILDQIAVIRRAEVGRIAQKYGLDMNSATDRSIAAEEVLANMAQTNPQLGFVRRAIAEIRTWLRSVGLNMRVSDDEIVRDFLLPARAFVTQGRNAVSPGLSPALSRQDVERAMRAGGDAIRNLRAGGYKSAWQRFKDTLAHRRDVGLTLLGRRQIAEVYGKLLPALHDYSNEMQKYDAEKNSVAADADELIGRWRRLPDRIRLADTMHGATLTGYDPDVSKTNPSMMTPEMREVYDNWNRLSDDAKAVYRQARDMYAHHWLKVKHAIRARVERAEIDGKRKKAMLGKIEDEFTKQLAGVYFPLARFGSYVVTVRDEDGKTLAVVRAESLTEAREERARLQRENPDADVSKIILAKEYNAARDSVSKAFIQDLYGVLETSVPAGEDVEQLKDAINQLYLTSLPDVSWAKHGLHRKGTPGFDSDARRAFANNMFHGSYYLAKLNHADVLSDFLRDMQEYVDEKRDDHEYDSVAAQQVIHEMHRRHDLTMNPPYNPLTERLTAAGFIYMLGASPASALVNLSQTPLVAYPMLGAEFGWAKSSTELLKASREVLEAKNDLRSTLKGDELQAFSQAVRDGIIDITQAHDLAAVAEGRDSQLHGAMAPFMRAASFLFHHAERFNRQATFMAAYRMAVAKGQSSEAAFDTARRLTYASHFDYAQSNRPRVMMGSWSKVLFLFKQYGQNMAYTLARNAIESVKGETPADRARALKTLSGLLVATGLSAGLMGLPMVTILLGVASLIGSTDDEPWDAEAALRNMLADALGKPAGEMLAHGMFRGILPGDIAGRVGLDSLFVKDIDLTLDPNKVWQELVYAGLGPVLSIGVNQAKGVADILKGDYLRGTEEMLPKALGDILKAFRYGTKGVVDRSGVEIVKDATALELAAQALGFTPARVKESYEGRRAVMGLERDITARHNELLSKFSRAVIDHDDEARVDALRQIQAFNEKQPANGITSRAMLQSIQNRMRRIAEAQNGIALPRKQRPLASEGRFANVE